MSTKALLVMLRRVTEALEDADAAYHNQFEGNDDAMDAYKRPEWERTAKAARALLAKVGG